MAIAWDRHLVFIILKNIFYNHHFFIFFCFEEEGIFELSLALAGVGICQTILREHILLKSK